MNLEAEFDRCWPWLQAANETGGLSINGFVWCTHSKTDIWQRIVRGQAKLWPYDDCAFVTEIYYHPTGLRSHNTWLAGGEKNSIVAATPTIEEWGREHGCHRQTGNGRRGWLRELAGYEEIGTRRQKNLLAPGETPQLHK